MHISQHLFTVGSIIECFHFDYKLQVTNYCELIVLFFFVKG